MASHPQALVCGGSIGGLIAAHSLLRAGWHVTVFEQAAAIVPAGAGLGLDETSAAILESLSLREGFEAHSLAMPTEFNCAVHDRQLTTLFRNPKLGYRSTHWSLIHQMLLDALPDHGQGIVHFGHRVLSFQQPDGSCQVIASVCKSSTDSQEDTLEARADLLVAADGSMSRTRAEFIPNEPRRYAGYSAWRGVMHTAEIPDIMQQLRKEYPELGRAMFFIMEKHGHAVLYEVPDRINWMWYRNCPEPPLKGSSVTYRPSPDQIAQMKEHAAKTWSPALNAIMQATSAPFVNAIFDREPLDSFVYGRVALLGEAAHPTTPHAGRSTNMAISDAACLGEALTAHPDDITAALQQYNSTRVPAARRAVLFSRWLGQLKQGWLHGDNYAWQDSHDVDEILLKTPQLNALQFEPERHTFAHIPHAC